MELLQIEQATSLLLQYDHVLFLCHQNPDGDTIGSGYALCHAFHQMGRCAGILCADPVPKRMSFVTEELNPSLWISPEQAKYIVSVDIADKKLLGAALSAYQPDGTVDLAIDHHGSHRPFAKKLLLCDTEAANCQIIYDILLKMGCPITPKVASCLYLGLSTDTGCFRYSNTQPKTHQLAANLMSAGADWFNINRKMFELKTRSQMDLEQKVLQTLRFYCGGRAAVLIITQQMLQETGATMEETESIISIPKSIEGVEIGVTFKERPEGGFKVSVRTSETVDASSICAVFGGGGHIRAAGCLLKQPLEDGLFVLVRELERTLNGQKK